MDKNQFLVDVTDWLLYFNINHDVAHFIACQFALESDFGQSSLAKHFHNYCGMKLPKFRLSTAVNLGSSDKYAHYSSLFFCVFDFVLCLMCNSMTYPRIDTIDLYKSSINWYCHEPEYVERIQIIYNQFYIN